MLNDLDTSSSHLERLMRDLGGSQTINQHFTEDQQPLIKTQLSNFSTLVTKLRSTLRVRVFESMP